MHHFCTQCGAKNPYVNGLKPKFCAACGEPLAGTPAKARVEESRSVGRPIKEESRSSWRDEWKGRTVSSKDDDEADLDEIMRGLKRDNCVTVEKSKMLTVGALKEMDSFDGRGDAPQADKDLAPVRQEILKNLGVQQ